MFIEIEIADSIFAEGSCLFAESLPQQTVCVFRSACFVLKMSIIGGNVVLLLRRNVNEPINVLVADSKWWMRCYRVWNEGRVLTVGVSRISHWKIGKLICMSNNRL